MAASSPVLIVLGGPNGAGKSTAAPMILRDELAVAEFVNADVIAQGLSGFAAEGVAMAAGRMMLHRIAELMSKRIGFAFESTLASRTLAGHTRNARTQGYRIHIVYLWLDTADLAVARVRERAELGGHLVPEDTIRRRYYRGIENFFRIYRPLADHWRFYDNSRMAVPRLIARGGAGMAEEVLDGTAWKRARSCE